MDVECDMNYDAHVENGRRHVPCHFRFRLPEAGRVAKMLLRYASSVLGNSGFLSVDIVNEYELSVKIYVDVMSAGYTAGEIIDSLINMAEGYLYCLEEGGGVKD